MQPAGPMRFSLCGILCASLVVLPVLARSASAESVAAGARIERSGEVAAAERLGAWLEREDVVRELERLGVAPAEARARLAALSEAEVAALAGRVDRLPAGGDGVGAVVAAILIVFLVLLVTDILGFTDIFPWVKKPHQR